MAWNGFSGPAAAPPPAPPSDFADRFSSDYQATTAANLGAGSRNRMLSETYQDIGDKVFAVTGRKVDNPVWAVDDAARSNAHEQIVQAWGQAREKDPSIGEFPDVQQLAVERAQQYQRTAAARQATSGTAGAIGGFLGGTVGDMEHPVQMLTMPYGGFWGKGGSVAVRILKEGGENALIAGATQVPIEVGAADWRKKLGIESNFGQNVAGAAIGGGLFGAGAKALGEGASALLGRAAKSPPPAVNDAPWWPTAEAYARQYGVHPGYIGNLAAIESGGQNIATNIKKADGSPGSSASGLFQFTTGTWNAIAQKNPDLGITAADKGDVRAQAGAIAALTAENQTALRQSLGRDPTWTELYGAHVFGASPAGKLAEASPNSPLIDVVGRDAIEANPQWNGWTVGKWRAKYDEAFGRSAIQAPEPIPQHVTDAQRMVDRGALDAAHAIGGVEDSKLHRENMVAAERAIVDGPDVPVTPIAPRAVSDPIRDAATTPAPATRVDPTSPLVEPAAVSGSPGPPKALPYEYVPMDVSQPTEGRMFYHGTKAKIDRLSQADVYQFSNAENLYGEGLYLTDNPNIAASYAAKKGKGPAGKVLSATLNDVRLMDLERPLPKDAFGVYADAISGVGGKIPENSNTTGRVVFGELKQAMQDNGITGSDALEIYGDINARLAQLGYDGLRHEGGVGGFGKHNVAILFEYNAIDREGNQVGRLLRDKFADAGILDVGKKLAELHDSVVKGEIDRNLDLAEAAPRALDLQKRASESGETVADRIVNGEESATPKEMLMLHAMHDDFALRQPSSPETIAKRMADYVDEAKRLKGGEGEPLRKPGITAVAARSEPEPTVSPLHDTPEPQAADALASEARRQVADALTTKGELDQVLDIGDGTQVHIADLDSTFNRLDREAAAADIISSTCILFKAGIGEA